jgi:O-antigen ligase
MLLLGFATLGAYAGSRKKWRYVFLLGPVLGVSGVFLSGTRGAGVAVITILIALTPVFVLWSRRDWRFLVAVFGFSVLGTVLFNLSPHGHRAATGIFAFISGVLSGDFSVIDQQRTEMLNGALAAFRESPIWGHGWGDMMGAAERHYPAESRFIGDYDHLHSDIANFAVIGGILGLAAYALLICAPILTAFLCRSQWRFPAIILGVNTSVGYFSLGLTNAMFGILPQTVLYTALLGWILLLAAEGQN